MSETTRNLTLYPAYGTNDHHRPGETLMETVRDLQGWTVTVTDTPPTRARLWIPRDDQYHDGRWMLIVDFVCEGNERHGAKRADTPEQTFGLLNECLHPDNAAAVAEALTQALKRDDFRSSPTAPNSTRLLIAAACLALFSFGLNMLRLIGIA